MKNYKVKVQDFKKIADNLETLILDFPEDKRENIIFDRWSLKDVISHLNHWMVHDIDCLTALLDGKVPFWESDVETFNTRGIEKRRDLTWNKVFNEFLMLKKKLINLYESIDGHLINERIWPDRNQTPLRFVEDDIKHWKGEHLAQLEGYLLKNK